MEGKTVFHHNRGSARQKSTFFFFCDTKWPISVAFFPLMRLRGKMSTRSSSHTEINWTRLWVVITHVTLDFGKGIHTLSARRRLIMEKLSRRRRSRLVSACGTRLVNNRLSETCAHHCLSGENLRDVQTVGPTQTSRRITLRLIGTTGKPAQSCWTQALFFSPSFYNCPHSVHHQQGGARNWTRKGHLVEELFADKHGQPPGDNRWSRWSLDLGNVA